MRISDWSSDVCSSDLAGRVVLGQREQQAWRRCVRALPGEETGESVVPRRLDLGRRHVRGLPEDRFSIGGRRLRGPLPAELFHLAILLLRLATSFLRNPAASLPQAGNDPVNGAVGAA